MNKPSTEKTNTVWFYLYEVSKVVRFIETELNSDCQGLGERGRQSCLMGTVSVSRDGKSCGDRLHKNVNTCKTIRCMLKDA
jgi:hypothetical protein